MRDINQTIIKFNYDQNFNNEDFYVSKSNKYVFDFLSLWQKRKKNFVIKPIKKGLSSLYEFLKEN